MRIQATLKAALAACPLLSEQASSAPAQKNITSIPGQYTYLLPQPYEANLTQDFISGTSLNNKTVAYSLSEAQSSPFVSFSQEFEDLIGTASLQTIVACTSFPFTWAGEAGIWVPDLNQVWFTSTLYGGPTSLYVLFLENNTVIKPEFLVAKGYSVRIPLANPAGGYYFDGTVYVCLTGDERESASLIGIDPYTYQVTPIVNSYFGLELPPIDDVVVAYTNTSAGFHKHFVSPLRSVCCGHSLSD